MEIGFSSPLEGEHLKALAGMITVDHYYELNTVFTLVVIGHFQAAGNK